LTGAFTHIDKGDGDRASGNIHPILPLLDQHRLWPAPRDIIQQQPTQTQGEHHGNQKVEEEAHDPLARRREDTFKQHDPKILQWRRGTGLPPDYSLQVVDEVVHYEVEVLGEEDDLQGREGGREGGRGSIVSEWVRQKNGKDMQVSEPLLYIMPGTKLERRASLPPPGERKTERDVPQSTSTPASARRTPTSPATLSVEGLYLYGKGRKRREILSSFPPFLDAPLLLPIVSSTASNDQPKHGPNQAEITFPFFLSLPLSLSPSLTAH